MEKFKVNLCVINLNDGGELILERYDEMDERLKELGDYFNDYGERDEEEVEEFEQLKKQYVELIGDKKGKFYLWGIEYDLQLMFEEN